MEPILRDCLSDSEQWCDVHLQCGSKLFKAHRVVLSSVSPFLRVLLLSRADEDFPITIVLPGFEHDAMTAVLQYVYNGEVSIQMSILLDFFHIIKALQINVDKNYLNDLRLNVETFKDFDVKSVYTNYNRDLNRKNRLKKYDTMDSVSKDAIKVESEDKGLDLEAFLKSDKISKTVHRDGCDNSSEEAYIRATSNNSAVPVAHSNEEICTGSHLRQTHSQRDDASQKNSPLRDSPQEFCSALNHDNGLTSCVRTISNETSVPPSNSVTECSFNSVQYSNRSFNEWCSDRSNLNRTQGNAFSHQNRNEAHRRRLDIGNTSCNKLPGALLPQSIHHSNYSLYRNLNNYHNRNTFFHSSSLEKSAAHLVSPQNHTMEYVENNVRIPNVLKPVPSLLPISSMLNFIQSRDTRLVRPIPELLDLSSSRFQSQTSRAIPATFSPLRSINNGYNILDIARNNRSTSVDGIDYCREREQVASSFSVPNGLLYMNEEVRDIRVSPEYAINRLPKKAYNKVLDSPWCAKSPIYYRQSQSLNNVETEDSKLDKHLYNFLPTSPKIPTDINKLSHSTESNDKNNNFNQQPLFEKNYKQITNIGAATPLMLENNNNDTAANKNDESENCTKIPDVRSHNPHSIDKIMMSKPLAKELPATDGSDACAIQCEICSKMFTSRLTLAAHMKSHSSQGRYHCDQCDKSFSQLRNYKYHISVHKGTKEFAATCNVCGKYFNDRGYLSSHMKIHRNRKEYQCPHCPKSFNQRVAYNMHVRIHTGVKPHACAECGKAFSRKMLLKQHQRTHSGEKPYACAVCAKRFADRSNMTLHLRLHTGIKPFSCTLCPKSFTKKHHLKTHLNYHTGNKPYACEKCGLTFSQSSNMRTHMKKCSGQRDRAADKASGSAGASNSDLFTVENLTKVFKRT